MLLLALLLTVALAEDVLVYQPLMMPSHATFMARIVEVLADANYSLVVLVNRHRADFPHGCDKAKEIITVPPVPGLLDGMNSDFVWIVKETPYSQWQAMNALTIAHGKQCKALLNDQEALAQLRGRKFRMLVHEVFDMCGLVLMEMLNIDQQIIVSSTRQMDTVGYELGLTDPFRHAGILSDYGGTFGWKDVLRNAWFIDSFLKFTDNQIKFYKDELRHLKVPIQLRKVVRGASAVFLNTHPLTDSWRPSLRNVYDVGGIALHKPKPLDKNFELRIREWKKVVLVSFGTIAPSSSMPIKWKQNLVNVIESFSEVLFLWKYEVNDTFSEKKVPNIIMSSFFPQNDLLHSGLIDVFITHGGQNSIMEATSAGVRMLVIPQFGDQFRNSMAVKERNLGKILSKSDLGNFAVLSDAINEMIKQERVHKKVSHMINTKLAVQTFLTKMEEGLQSGLTFEDGPEVYDVVEILNCAWTILCVVLLISVLKILYRTRKVFICIYQHMMAYVHEHNE